MKKNANIMCRGSGWHWPTPSLMQTLAKKFCAMHRGADAAAGGEQREQGERAVIVWTQRRGQDRWALGSLCRPSPPSEYFTQSLLIIWPGSPDVQGSGDLLNICNGRRKKGRKVSLVMATLVTSDLCYVNTNIMST